MTYRFNLFKSHILILLSLMCSSLCISQSAINRTAHTRAALGIKSSKGYNFKIINNEISTDSTLAVTRKFNDKGYRTETAVYRNGILATTYQFEYQDDTLLVSLKSYINHQKKFIQESLFKYDNNKNLVKQYEADKDNGPNMTTKYKYNKLGQRIKSTFRSMGRKITEEKFKYDERGNKIEKISCIPTKQRFIYRYDKWDRLTHVHKILKNGTKVLLEYYEYQDSRKTKHILHTSRTKTGINGPIKLSYSDTLTKEEIIGLADQIIKETEYLNGQLNGYRRYYYE